MLKVFHDHKELHIHNLFRVYEESLKQKAQHEGCSIIQAEDDFIFYLEEVFFSSPDAFYAVWTENARYVSALRIEPYEDGFLLSGLETAPDERSKGFATKLLLAVKEYATGTNRLPVYSHIHKGNSVSLALHRRCGFVQKSDFGRLIDGTVSGQYYTLMWK